MLVNVSKQFAEALFTSSHPSDLHIRELLCNLNKKKKVLFNKQCKKYKNY